MAKMKRKRASEIFAEVDPHLKVINGGTHYRRRLGNADWDKAGGIYCSQCRQETLRLVDGLCPECWRDRETKRMEKVEDRSMRRYYKRGLRKGTVSLAQMREGGL